ncbi:MAG: PorP/SprF family type IX secretion system membrane protein [Crocinitomicaceae bacterium]|nr:PorP/SprF family type IX secretion system membrane protein [Crocinitomicaceae bacterium]MCF8445135.1 PorP/SprF family type IX secretion system membrane protein [Crocinitomicaceae bacterium]
MKKIICFVFAAVSLVSIAQQTPQSNVYTYNRFSINPAYTGASGCTEINFSHLNQWVKVEGAPLTSYVGVNTRLGKNIGIGGQVLVDKIGMINQVTGMGAISYGLTFAKFHTLRFGLGVGYNQYRVNPTSAIAFDNQDPIINGGSQSSGTLNSELGIFYQWKNLELSVASKQLLQTYTNFGYTSLDGYGLRRHFNALAAYRINVNNNLAIKPSVFMKGINTGMQTDLNADVIYKSFIQAGIGYRTQVGLIARAGINIQDLFFIGYAYETPMRNIASFSSGSHEVILGLKFCKSKKKQEIVEIIEIDSSFNMAKKSTEPIIQDTVFVQKTDTVFITKGSGISNDEVNTILLSVERNLLFEKQLFNIQTKSFEELKSLAQVLALRQDIMIEVEGHTDNRGDDAENMQLSKDRANEVKAYLVKNGIEGNRVKVSYYGETKPMGNNESESGRQMNRRVRIKIINKE